MSGQLFYHPPLRVGVPTNTPGLLVRRPTDSNNERRPTGSRGGVVGSHPQAGGTDNLPNKFTHIYFTFNDGAKLYFNDLRKFGWARLVDKVQVDKLLREFGVEPLSKEFTLEALKKILSRRQNKTIKQVLMEQELIAGIGNIYADESCFCAKIKPTRLVKTLMPVEVAKLRQCIPKILKFAISKKGTSANTYVQLDGRPGGMVPYLKVYGRAKLPCKVCKTEIQKIKLGGRGTHFCPKCQK